jgi:preprotein translocase subunit SecG
VILTYLIVLVHLLVSIFLILVVLLQQGKGADLSVFGGGSTQTAFGAVGATSLLHKLTVGSFVAFILTTMTLGVLDARRGDSSVISGREQPAAETPAADPATELPGAPATEPGSGPETAAPTEAPEGGAGDDGDGAVPPDAADGIPEQLPSGDS